MKTYKGDTEILDEDVSSIMGDGNLIKREQEESDMKVYKMMSDVKDTSNIKIHKDHNKRGDMKTESVDVEKRVKSKMSLVIILGVIGCILLFIAANKISIAGISIIDIRLEAGSTVVESYYQNIGKALRGFAMFSRGLGISILAITISLGRRNLNK